MPNMPTLSYMLRSCATLNSCGSPSIGGRAVGAEGARWRYPVRGSPRRAGIPHRLHVTGKRCSRPAVPVDSVSSSARFGFGGRRDLQDEVGKGLHLGAWSSSAVPAQQPHEGTVEFLERSRPRRAGRRRRSLPAVRSPRQCMDPWVSIPRSVCVVMGPFMGWKGLARTQHEGERVVDQAAFRVAQVPGQFVLVALDVATRAGGLAVTRGSAWRRTGTVDRRSRWRAPGCAGRYGSTSVWVVVSMTEIAVIEAGRHIEPVVGLVQHQAARAAGAQLNMARQNPVRSYRFPAPLVSNTPTLPDPLAAT